jgi:hypothetical protein
MKAMVFAAGRGTRLKPLTDTRPKALVEVGGVTLLELTLRRLAAAGVVEAIVNLHHFGEQIPAFIEKHGRFGLRRIEYSAEPELLDTGGGLKQAAWFFDDGRSFLVHNVDVLSDIDLHALAAEHSRTGALATLAAMPRPTAIAHSVFDGQHPRKFLSYFMQQIFIQRFQETQVVMCDTTSQLFFCRSNGCCGFIPYRANRNHCQVITIFQLTPLPYFYSLQRTLPIR